MLTKKQITFFNNNGYVKVKIFKKNKLNKFKHELAKLIKVSLKVNHPEFYKKIIRYNKNDDYYVHNGMLELSKKNRQFLVNIYNQLPSSVDFYKLLSDENIKYAVNQLLQKKGNSNLYVNATTIRMDVPGITPYVYGWHRDNNANILDSNFIQLWAPIISNVDKKLGGLTILSKSHGKNIKTDRSDRERELVRKLNMPSRPLLNAKIISKHSLKEKIITCELGSVILFHNSLLHKSGINKTKNKIRYVWATFYHDLFNENWKFKLLNEKSSNSKLTK